jgi:hypothetical protein
MFFPLITLHKNVNSLVNLIFKRWPISYLKSGL